MLKDSTEIEDQVRVNKALGATPGSAKKVATLRTKAEQAQAEVAASEERALAAFNQFERLAVERVTARKNLQAVQALNEDISNADALAVECVGQYVQSTVGRDTYAGQRFENHTNYVARLRALAPAMPDALKEYKAAVVSIEKQMRDLAETAGISIPSAMEAVRGSIPRNGGNQHADLSNGHYDDFK